MFKIGTSQIDITPAEKIALAGSFELRCTDKVHSRLYASSIVLDNGRIRIVWIACDLVFIDDDTVKKLRKQIADRLDTPETNVFISCTHTHNGPSLFKGLPYVDPDKNVVKFVTEAIVSSAVKAAESLCPAQMYYAAGSAQATFNRRYIKTNGKGWMSPGPQDTDIVCREGPEDEQLQVIWFEKLSGEKLCILVNYSAHATTAFSECAISADFPGEIRKILQAKYSSDLPVLYLQGACGNTSTINFDNPGDVPHGIESTELAGKIIADAAVNMMKKNANKPMTDSEIAVSSVTINMPVREIGGEDLPPAEAAKYIKEHPLETLDMNSASQMLPWYFAKCMVDMEYGDMQQKSWPVELSVLRLGPIALAANPAELFVEFQMEIKQKAKMPVLISELTNGYCGYIITEMAWKNGSYEAHRALSSKLSPICGRMVVDKTLELIEGIF